MFCPKNVFGLIFVAETLCPENFWIKNISWAVGRGGEVCKAIFMPKPAKVEFEVVLRLRL